MRLSKLIVLLVLLLAGAVALAADRTVIYCPECGSENVTVTMIDEPTVERVSIDNLNFGVTAQTLEYRIHRYRAVCNKCGYQREFTN